MASEGEYPKVDGDISYASEINRLNPKIIGQINNYTSNIAASGTNYKNVGGSIIYFGTGSLQISEFFQIIASPATNDPTIYTDPTVGAARMARIIMSGAGMDNVVVAGPINYNQAFISLKLATNGMQKILTSGVITTSGGNIGSEYVFYLQTLDNTSVSATQGDFIIIGH